MAYPKMELGKFIRARREELGLTKADFARKLNVLDSSVHALEVRRHRITCQSARRLAKALQLQPQAFLNFITNQNAKAASNGLGELVRARRRELLFSQSDLARKLGVSKAYVSLIELGAPNLNQSDHMIELLAKVLKLDVAILKSLRPKRKVYKVKEEIRQSALGRFLTARRLELGLSQGKVAQRAGISVQTIHYIETNKTASIKVLGKVAEALECKIPLELLPKSASVLRQHFTGPAAS